MDITINDTLMGGHGGLMPQICTKLRKLVMLQDV